MDFNSSIDIIIRDLREVRQIIDDIKTCEGVPLFQIELAKSKCRSAEELIALLKTENKRAPEIPAEKPQEPVVSNLEKIIELSDAKNAAQIKTTAVSEPDAFSPEEITLTADPSPIIKEVHPAKDSEKISVPESAILADRFAHQSDRLNEQIGSIRREDDVASSIKTTPVTDLKDAIGINDRFYFVKEIFGGDQAAYTSAISKLNSSANMDDAKAVLMSYTGLNTESEAVVQLLYIVKRKFTSNG